MGALQPEKTPTYSVDTILNLAKRFPQLGLADSESLDHLQEEFMDFTLSPHDLPSPSMYTAADKTKKPRAGKFWLDVSNTKTHGESRFGTLYQLMSGLLPIPCSNADSELGFSILRKIHTDRRSSLDQSTIVALMSMKFNCDDCCFDVKFNEALLTKCKKATFVSLRQ